MNGWPLRIKDFQDPPYKFAPANEGGIIVQHQSEKQENTLQKTVRVTLH